ncbi:MAG: 2-phosphosulfolactate phosphatase [Bacteroidales bacterium]
MQIEILEFEEGARQARGLTVIIDVFRAFSVECYAIDSGAARIIATGDPDEAFRLKERYPNSLLAGERNERKIQGFDFGNSPTEIIKSDLTGKTLIHTTTAGTAGLVSAVNADLIITGSLVNASAAARFITERRPGHVSLVAMGFRAAVSAEEDLLCAEYIKSRLEGREADLSDRIAGLRHTAGQRFFNPENIDFSPPTDFFLCTMTDRFDFVLKAERRNDGNIDLRRNDF